MADILAWECSPGRGLAGLTYLKGVDGQWAIDIQNGRVLGEEFPPEAYFEMNPEHPKDVKLGEQHYNLEGMVVIGPRLSQFVRDLGDPDVQLLAVKILDHKGRVASSDFNIVHTTRLIDCIDPEASGAEWDPIDPELFSGWVTLTLKPDSHEFPPVFRVTHMPNLVFVRSDVAEKLHGLGFREVYLTPLDAVE
jgi:hypothetical protein